MMPKKKKKNLSSTFLFIQFFFLFHLTKTETYKHSFNKNHTFCVRDCLFHRLSCNFCAAVLFFVSHRRKMFFSIFGYICLLLWKKTFLYVYVCMRVCTCAFLHLYLYKLKYDVNYSYM